MSVNYPSIMSPFKIGGITIKNRLCVSAMGMHNFDAKGMITNEGIEYYTEFARGGFGLISTGSLAVDNEIDGNTTFDRLMPTGHRKNFITSCTELTDRVHAYGTKIFAQLSLGVGRNGKFKSASENPSFANPNLVVGELTKEEIKRKIELLVESADACKIAGFDGVEIHAMHWGYLLDQFAMALTNRRTDEYGGSLENRMRFMCEIVEGVKGVCGSAFPVTIRLGLKSYITGSGLGQASLTGENEIGRTLEEAVEISKLLEKYGYDALSCDVGVYESYYHACPPMYIPKGAYIPLAEAVKKEVSIPILMGGRMNDPDIVEKAIADGKIDAACFGRPSLADPNFPKKLALGKPETIRPCLSCCQCIGSEFRIGSFSGCAVNPAITRGVAYGLHKAMQPKKVVVIGGGVSGMEAALVATACGHMVTLLEAGDKLGGNLIAAGNHSFKGDIRDLVRWFEHELAEKRVAIRLNTPATVKLIKDLGAEVVLQAVGSSVIMPPIGGIHHKKCVSCIDVLENGAPVGESVAIVGGGLTGVEMAIDYAMEGKKVAVIEALPDILSSGLPVPYMQDLMIRDMLKHYKVDVFTDHMICGVNDEGAEIVSTKNKDDKKTLPADTVIMAVGFRPRPSMERDLNACGIPVYTIGDANRVGSIKTSIWDAYEVARKL